MCESKLRGILLRDSTGLPYWLRLQLRHKQLLLRMVDAKLQGDLFRPATHNTDPATSHRAEEQETRSGRRKAHALKVLSLVQLHPGWTATAIAQTLAGDPDFSTESHKRLYQVRRRLSDLKNLGVVRQQRIKIVREVLWFIVEET